MTGQLSASRMLHHKYEYTAAVKALAVAEHATHEAQFTSTCIYPTLSNSNTYNCNNIRLVIFAIHRSQLRVLAGNHCVVALGKLLTPVCLCHQAV